MIPDLIAWGIAALAAIPTTILTIELAAGLLPSRRSNCGGGQPRTTIIIPAHDEAAIIATTVSALRTDAGAHVRLLVVADNCGDDSAALAARAGAEVITRHDPARPGKGHALAFARDHLVPDPPDVVIVIDADCAIDAGGITRLAAAAHHWARPVQAAYLLRARADLGAMVAISGFAFLIRNLIRQRALDRLGAPALLTGSGMAFPWPAFTAAPLATGDLVEDLAIGIALARAGHPPRFLPEVRIWSDPARRTATGAQRTRWEQGFLRTAARQAIALIAQARWPLVWLGLHLLVPPLALLAGVGFGALLLLAGLSAAGTSPCPLVALATLLLLASLLLGLGWRRFGRTQVRARTLLLIPVYIIWKLPIYLAALFSPERRWVRTRRD